MVVVLNVAEKPSVSRAIAEILSRGQFQSSRGVSQYNPIFKFDANIMNHPCVMNFTSVAGHLMSTDFFDSHRQWHSCSPLELFDAPIRKFIPKDKELLKQQLENEAVKADWLILWLDCDREGENIAYEVMEVCLQKNRRLQYFRAHFSSIIPAEIFRATQTLTDPNPNWSDAVAARMEIDLRIGAAFTRFQTLRLRDRFNYLDGSVISYGPCQFPTLGFVCARYLAHEAFVREEFWSLRFSYREGGENPRTAKFDWKRNRVFDRIVGMIFQEDCERAREARIINVVKQETRKRRPVPLSTVEMQKRLARFARMPSHRIMTVAEALYNKGLISYPRTETDFFKEGENLQSFIENLIPHSQFGRYAASLINEGKFLWPSAGGHDDGAHPPIHPTKLEPSNLNSEEKLVYEFVCRHFLACCSNDAIGNQTIATAEIAGEIFTSRGLMVSQYNYLEVYKYEKWLGANLPDLSIGKTFMPHDLRLDAGETRPPPLLTEADLITLMDRNGIGTDATIAQHISTIQDRNYAVLQDNHFLPTPLGFALVRGYDAMNLSLDKPNLRAHMEAELKKISAGTRTKDAVCKEILEEMKVTFQSVVANASKLDEKIGEFYSELGPGIQKPKPPNCMPIRSLEREYKENQQIRGDDSDDDQQRPVELWRPVENDRNQQIVIDEEFPIQVPQPRRQQRMLNPPPAEYDNGIPEPAGIAGISCFKCHQPGHYSNNCPQRNQPANNNAVPAAGTGRRARQPRVQNQPAAQPSGEWRGGPRAREPASNNNNNQQSGSCFSCGQTGHWSTNCPTRSSMTGNVRTMPAINRSAGHGSSSGGVCFRCGQSGHFASNCQQA